mmetsp:Transcript_50263/g.81462  ORF Transcript_50263/g.81462 Transcript_50263/m.81462 type:complete len:99 (-) Transcript_50263:178-474(-)
MLCGVLQIEMTFNIDASDILNAGVSNLSNLNFTDEKDCRPQVDNDPIRQEAEKTQGRGRDLQDQGQEEHEQILLLSATRPERDAKSSDKDKNEAALLR